MKKTFLEGGNLLCQLLSYNKMNSGPVIGLGLAEVAGDLDKRGGKVSGRIQGKVRQDSSKFSGILL